MAGLGSYKWVIFNGYPRKTQCTGVSKIGHDHEPWLRFVKLQPDKAWLPYINEDDRGDERRRSTGRGGDRVLGVLGRSG